ncbi:response regulator [Desulfoluna sp.]|uniref:response regulator n=1 Tax=Desulfoluna sp. TaxID=2045199 RepID=UPI002608FA62|nr:response regulator [Desulfoluna sp.]
MDNPERQYIEELNHCIDFNDAVKGCALMPFFTTIPESIRHLTLKKLFLSCEAPGLPIIKFLTNDLKKKGKLGEVDWIIGQFLAGNTFGPMDENRLSFWADAMVELDLPQALPRLLDLVAISRSGIVLIAACRASLGLAGTDGPSLIKCLCEENAPQGMRIAETLPLTGKAGFSAVAALLGSTHHELRTLAIDIFAAAGSAGVCALTHHLTMADTNGIIHAVNALGRCGAPEAVPPLLGLLTSLPDDPNIRFAVYEAAGRLPSPKWALYLARGLADDSEAVRMAAARAVDRNITTHLIRGISNIVSFGDETAARVIGALIDSQSDNTLGFLFTIEGFEALTERHLTQYAHPEVRDHCVGFLKKKRFIALAARVKKAASRMQTSRPLIVCVDDSKMMLMLYMKKLNASGFEVIAFDNPETALREIPGLSPRLVITDLNMPEMDGFTMASQLRRHADRRRLPILMVTTQSDATPPAGDGASPVDAILMKPFSDEGLEEMVSRLIHVKEAVDF